MRARLIALHERRAWLLERADSERRTLAGFIERTDAPVRWWQAASAFVARHPLLMVAAFGLLVAARPARMLKWFAGGWSLFQLYRTARLWSGRAVLLAQLAARRQTRI